MRPKIMAAVAASIAITWLGRIGWDYRAPATPRDLRDAVADSAISTLKGEAGHDAPDVNIPEPQVQARTRRTADLSQAVPMAELSGNKSSDENGARQGAGPSKAGSYTPEDIGVLQLAPGEKPYEKLEALFAKGTPATRKDLEGIKFGRLFMRDGRIYGQMLGGVVGKLSGRFNFGDVVVRTPSYFDSQTRTWVIMEWYHRMFKWDIKFPEAAATAHEDKSMLQEYRISDGYIISRHITGTTWGYSYYFTAITLNPNLVPHWF